MPVAEVKPLTKAKNIGNCGRCGRRNDNTIFLICLNRCSYFLSQVTFSFSLSTSGPKDSFLFLWLFIVSRKLFKNWICARSENRRLWWFA